MFALNRRSLTVVSGVPNGSSGAGRFIAHLESRIQGEDCLHAKLIARPELPSRAYLIKLLKKASYVELISIFFCHLYLISKFTLSVLLVICCPSRRVLLLHPQHMGFRLACLLIQSRAYPALLYLLDSSFFCVSSYNHLKLENQSCLRCLALGPDQGVLNGCRPFPRRDSAAFDFLRKLKTLVRSGRLSLASQNKHQARLAQRHFCLESPPKVVGLWTIDWDEIFDTQPWKTKKIGSQHKWDVVFHGSCIDAKGIRWVMNLVEHCPDLDFLLPFERPAWFPAVKNCKFLPLSWETGLKDEVSNSRIVIVPSLWSAPIEGALVKSIACASAVAVVDNPTSFSAEIPEGILLRLPLNPESAADKLRSACINGWLPSFSLRADWLEKFARQRSTFVPELFDLALADECAI